MDFADESKQIVCDIVLAYALPVGVKKYVLPSFLMAK